MEQHSFGYWLKLKRKALDLTRQALANRLGYSAATIRKLEEEERRPSEQIVERLAELFHIPAKERTSFLRFARGDWKSAPGEVFEDEPWHTPAQPSRSRIPVPATSLIGREREIAVIHEYLLNDDIRLVTLVGPPGIGKTRLSIESARVLLPDFPDNVFFIALAPLDDPSLIAQTTAQSLGYVGIRNISTTEQLKEGIGEKDMLLVLDNCEHIIEDVASFASDLLSACPRLKILATSRESLRIPGEWLYPVPAFEVPAESLAVDMKTASHFPALTLFAERARAVRPDFVLNAGNIQTVTSICAHLDGLPLVIELIAARLRLMSPEALLARLDQQFILSADGMRAASVRQKTLNHAIGWSYNLLSVEEQKLFVSLSVFSGGFTLDAAEAIFPKTITEKAVSNLVVSLLDKSLLQRASNVGDEARFVMLVTIQEFARNRLREMGEETEIRNGHLAYFLALAEKADKELRGHGQLEWLRRLETEIDNLRAALNWAIETNQTKASLRMARKLDWFWFVRGDHTEGRQWLGRVLDMPDIPLYPEAHAEILTQLAHHSYVQLGAEQARPFAEQALLIARAHADIHNIARGLTMLGLVLSGKDFEASQAALEESKTFYQEVNDEWGYAHAMMCLSWVFYDQDDYVTMLSLNEQALPLFRNLGDGYFECVVLRGIGVSQIRQGNLVQGIAALQDALMLAIRLNSKFEIGMTLWRFAEAASREKKLARAVCLFWATRNVLDSIGAWTEGDTLIFENDLATYRTTLGESTFTEERGRAMTMEQAIAYALEE